MLSCEDLQVLQQDQGSMLHDVRYTRPEEYDEHKHTIHLNMLTQVDLGGLWEIYTSMLYVARSKATAWVRPLTAHLLTEYANAFPD